MPTAAWISVLVTLILFVISHIIITVWWASRVNTLLDVVQRDLTSIIKEFQTMRGSYATKEDLAYRVAVSDKEHAAMWKRIDELKVVGP